MAYYKDMQVAKIRCCDNCGAENVSGIHFVDEHKLIVFSACKNCLQTGLQKLEDEEKR